MCFQMNNKQYISFLKKNISLLLFSHWVMSDSLWSHGLLYTRLPRPSLSLGVCSNSCPLSWWCYLTNLILCIPLFLLPSVLMTVFFPNELALRIRWPKYWSSSFSISPSNEYLRLISFRMTGLISLPSKGLSSTISNTEVQ